MSASSTIDIFDTFVANIGTTIEGVLPIVLVIGASLIGLAFGLKYVRRFVGKRG